MFGELAAVEFARAPLARPETWSLRLLGLGAALIAAGDLPALSNNSICRSGAPTEIGEIWFGNAEPRTAPTLFRKFNQEAFGKAWPLAADEALVGCALEMPGRTVMLVVAGHPRHPAAGWPGGGAGRR